jgi:hypothetical protein
MLSRFVGFYGTVRGCKAMEDYKKFFDRINIHCEVDLCIYNKDCNCTLDTIEIEPPGRCHQCMVISLSENLELIPKDAVKLIKEEYLKNEEKLWKNRLFQQEAL